jgi:hypothetical protein
MRERHCSSDELIAHLYGLKSADEHLNSCGECSARLRQAELRRTEAAEAPEVPDELLAAQRRSIYQRLGSPVAAWHPLRWAGHGHARNCAGANAELHASSGTLTRRLVFC